MENDINLRDVIRSFWTNKFFVVIVSILTIFALTIPILLLNRYFGYGTYTTTFEFAEFGSSNDSTYSNGVSISLSLHTLENIYSDTEEKVITEQDFNDFLLYDLLQVKVYHSYSVTNRVNIYSYAVSLNIDEISSNYEYSEDQLIEMSDDFSSKTAEFIYVNKISRSMLSIFEEAYSDTQSNIERLALLEYTIGALQPKLSMYSLYYDAYKEYLYSLPSGKYINNVTLTKLMPTGVTKKYVETSLDELGLLTSDLYYEFFVQKNSYDFGATNNTEFYSKINDNTLYLQQKRLSGGNSGITAYITNCLEYLDDMKNYLVANIESGSFYSPYIENDYDTIKTSVSTVTQSYQELHSASNGIDHEVNIALSGEYKVLMPKELSILIVAGLTVVFVFILVARKAKKPSVVILHKQ